jgi:hypothetical protein
MASPAVKGLPGVLCAKEPHDGSSERLGDVGVVMARRGSGEILEGVADIFQCLRGVCVVTSGCKVHDCTEEP